MYYLKRTVLALTDSRDKVSLPLNPRTRRKVGFGFVYLGDGSDIKRACQELDGTMCSDRKISVQVARRQDEDQSEEGVSDSGSGASVDEEGLGSESGEISEHSIMSISSDDREKVILNLDGANERESRGRLGLYNNRSQTNSLHTPPGSPRKRNAKTPEDSYNHLDSALLHHVPVLADLNSEELELQLRYFHITKDPASLNLKSTVVHCLACGGKGHLGQSCEMVTCESCGLHKKATTESCPADDESLWRTSRILKDVPLNIRTTQMGCYECGLDGHLGNDCPTRRPGKGYGTSSWTIWGRNQSTQPSSMTTNVSSRPKAELKIKGGAGRQQPIYIDDDSDNADDPAHFINARVPPQQGRRGQISIAAPTTFGPRPGDRSMTQHRDRARDGGHRTYDEGSGYYDTDTYEDGNSRHYSPSLQDFRRMNSFQPPLPNEPLPKGVGRRGNQGSGRRKSEMYRPMPSSAQQAWKKHLI